MKNLGIQTRQLVLLTPIDREYIALRIGLSLMKHTTSDRLHPLLKRLLCGLHSLLTRLIFMGYAHDVRQDFPGWPHKTCISLPAPAGGDGLVGRYSCWARWFYPKEAV